MPSSPGPDAPAPLSHADLTPRALAATIDHSLLQPDLDVAGVEAGCRLAERHHVASVCVKPCDVALAARILAGSDVRVGTVIGFPHGASRADVKLFEAERALDDGAVELDMVLDVGHLRSGLDDEVRDELRAVTEAAAARGSIVKAILENAYLDDDEKRRACRLCEEAGAQYVKTSTGFAPSGATVHDVRLMRAAVSPHVGVKAAGGVRTLDALVEVVEAGASRVGTSATESILDELARRRRAAADDASVG
jgi:deoxyribose-phosphate aldolase